MRDSKELLMSNVKDLTEEEVKDLSTWEYNYCDKCGEVSYSGDLKWCGYAYWQKPEEDEFGNELRNEEGGVTFAGDYQALCEPCFNKLLDGKKIELCD